MTDAVIKLNNTRDFELEFEVNIAGISTDEEAPNVRFAITNVYGGDLTFECEKVVDSNIKWKVKLPALPILKDNAHKFRIEVIVDGYYFAPAEGNLLLIREPKVDLPGQKPSVTAKVTTEPEKKEEEEKKEEKKPTNEKIGGGGTTDALGQTAPTTNLLKTEFPPDYSEDGNTKPEHPQSQRRRPEDEMTDEEKLGKHTHDDESDEDDEHEPYDSDNPERIAEMILQEHSGDAVGGVKGGTKGGKTGLGVKGKATKPSKPGFLFSRTKDGKPYVAGMEIDPKIKEQQKKTSEKVKKILSKD